MTVNYGLFINSIVTFVIVAFAVFMMVKTFNKWREEEEEVVEEAPAEPAEDIVLLTEIRDALRSS